MAMEYNPYFAPLLQAIPLERCDYATDLLTGKTGWHARQGQIFVMTGSFVVNTDTSPGDMCTYMPQESAALAAGSEPDPDLEFLGEPPLEFTGKWLTIDTPREQQTIYIQEDAQPYYDDAYLMEFEGTLIPITRFSGIVEWTQRYAEGVWPDFAIALVDIEEPAWELIIPPSDPLDIIQLPISNKRPTLAEYFGEQEVAMMTDEEKRNLLKQYRDIGRPFSDDPFAGFIFPDEHTK